MGLFYDSVKKLTAEAPAIQEKFLEEQKEIIELISDMARLGCNETTTGLIVSRTSKEPIVKWLNDEGFFVEDLSKIRDSKCELHIKW